MAMQNNPAKTSDAQRSTHLAGLRLVLCLLPFVLYLLVAGTAPAQAVPPSAAPASGAAPASTVSVPPEYRLGPGDVLEVAVPTHEGFNATLTVQPDGRIYYQNVGEIMVTGLTIPELTTRIREG